MTTFESSETEQSILEKVKFQSSEDIKLVRDLVASQFGSTEEERINASTTLLWEQLRSGFEINLSNGEVCIAFTTNRKGDGIWPLDNFTPYEFIYSDEKFTCAEPLFQSFKIDRFVTVSDVLQKVSEHTDETFPRCRVKPATVQSLLSECTDPSIPLRKFVQSLSPENSKTLMSYWGLGVDTKAWDSGRSVRAMCVTLWYKFKEHPELLPTRAAEVQKRPDPWTLFAPDHLSPNYLGACIGVMSQLMNRPGGVTLQELLENDQEWF